MDVHDVASQYTQLITRQKETLLAAKRRQGQRPRDRKSREYAYSKFMVALMASPNRDDRHMVHSSFVPPAYVPCTTPMAELTPITIEQLQLEIHHRGGYLVLRSITPPSRMTAIMVIMEDEFGDAVVLQLYQQEDEHARPAADIVDVGTLLLVKEPFYKVMGDGDYGLRVDHLSDLVHLKGGDARIPESWQPRVIEVGLSADSLKIKGNLAMKDGRNWDAIADYSNALGQSTTQGEIEIIKRNRSLAFLKTKQFDAALVDTGFPDFSPNPTEKAMFRAAEALYNLERFAECCQVLDLFRTKFPDNSQALVILKRARSRLNEQNSGIYDFKQLQAKAKKLRPPHLDHASYVGPVEIRLTEFKGRGLFATKEVKAGDLLLCEKAFIRAHVEEDTGSGNMNSSKLSLLLNPETNKGSMGAQADLIKLIVQKLRRNPSVAPAFTTLHHGAYEGVTTSAIDGEPIVDTFLVERIISFNVFGCPVSSLESHQRHTKGSEVVENPGKDVHHSCGIWTHASYINHSCASNARRAFIGNMMIVRASRDISAGSEVTFWYHSPIGTSEKELQGKLQHWGFVCKCAICLDARETDTAVLTRRRKLMADLKRAFKPLAQTEKIERVLGELNKTYLRPAEEVPRLLLWDPQLALVRIYSERNQAGKSIEAVGKVLASLGFVIVGADSSPARFAITKWGLAVDYLVETFLHAKFAFVALGLGDDSQRAEEYARTAYGVVIGEHSSFDETYG